MKRIYFVRHGSTKNNENDAYQFMDTSLSDKGVEQARLLGERFVNIPFDVLISSDMTRAQETAHAIAVATGREIMSEKLFREIRRPSTVWGRPKKHPEVLAIMDAVQKTWATESEHLSDEENFYDFKQRALAALEYLRNRPEETLVVVTHGFMLKMMITAMLQGEAMQPEHYAKMDEFMFPENTGVSWCEYDNQFHPENWQLITWNDHAHLRQ